MNPTPSAGPKAAPDAAPARGRMLALALLAWTLGALVYGLERSLAQVWLHPAAWHWPTAQGSLPAVLRDSLPSAAHACAFSLLSAALLPHRLALWACAGWWAADSLLEVAQHPVLHRWLVAHGATGWPPGHFDPQDLAAVALGSLLAAALAIKGNPEQRS